MRKNRFITGLSILVFFFLFFPLLIVITTSFGTEAIIAFPIKGFTLDWYLVALRSKTFMSALSLSLFLGITATGLALLVGIPVAYILSRNRLKSGNLIITDSYSGDCHRIFFISVRCCGLENSCFAGTFTRAFCYQCTLYYSCCGIRHGANGCFDRGGGLDLGVHQGACFFQHSFTEYYLRHFCGIYACLYQLLQQCSRVHVFIWTRSHDTSDFPFKLYGI